MRFAIVFLSILSLLMPRAWAEGALTQQECHAIVRDLEQMSNLQPAEVEERAPAVLEQLRDGESLTSYFIAYNIYVENLFNKGKVDKARAQIEQMLAEAYAGSDAESRAIALRTQGQFYFKLGLYERAAECFRQAMEQCPRYDSPRLEHCFTWSSTLFWLVQADLHSDNLDEAAAWIAQMDGMMEWLETVDMPDRVGYKPVMIRGLRAKIDLARGDTEAACSLLQQCPQYMLPDIPSRAYVEYYVATMQLYISQNRHEEALPLLDELIEMHRSDYKPIAAEYLYQKGLSLNALGRYEESAQILLEYIQLKVQLDKVALAEQLDELTTRYEVEKLQHERDNIRRQLLIVIAICAALAIIVTMMIVNRKRLRRKNKTLARHISELSRVERPVAPSGDTPEDISEPEEETAAEGDDQASPSDISEIGGKIVDYINTTQCYRRADCSRDTIKDGLGISERTLAKAIMAATGYSFVNYINRLRLNVSVKMLEEHPEMTIGDISTACGFGTVRQFQRIFKQQYDLTPSAYRTARGLNPPA